MEPFIIGTKFTLMMVLGFLGVIGIINSMLIVQHKLNNTKYPKMYSCLVGIGTLWFLSIFVFYLVHFIKIY